MGTEGQGIPLDLKVCQEQKTRKDLDAAQDGVKDVDVTYLFKNTIYIYADNVSERLQFL